MLDQLVRFADGTFLTGTLLVLVVCVEAAVLELGLEKGVGGNSMPTRDSALRNQNNVPGALTKIQNHVFSKITYLSLVTRRWAHM